jgi:pyroglutamyl-peptidase
MNDTTLLLTGFEPFGDYDLNSSWEAIRGLDGMRAGTLTIRSLLLPVEYRRGPETLLAEIRRTRPRGVVSFGVSPGPRIRPERTARNRTGGKADSAGETLPEHLVPGGTEELASTLPCEELAMLLTESGFDAEVSDDAGGYVCNAVFYRLLHHAPGIPAGFVHLPPLGSPYGMDELQRAALLIARRAAAISPPEKH